MELSVDTMYTRDSFVFFFFWLSGQRFSLTNGQFAVFNLPRILSEQNLELLMGQFYTSTTSMYSRGNFKPV